jgi:hypothetical protein
MLYVTSRYWQLFCNNCAFSKVSLPIWFIHLIMLLIALTLVAGTQTIEFCRQMSNGPKSAEKCIFWPILGKNRHFLQICTIEIVRYTNNILDEMRTWFKISFLRLRSSIFTKQTVNISATATAAVQKKGMWNKRGLIFFEVSSLYPEWASYSALLSELHFFHPGPLKD